jgi:hypothetical protein
MGAGNWEFYVENTIRTKFINTFEWNPPAGQMIRSITRCAGNIAPIPSDTCAATLALTLPAGINFLRIAATGLTCTPQLLQCALAELAPQTTISATFTLRATATGTKLLAAHANIPTSTNPDPASAAQQLSIRCHQPATSTPTGPVH